MIKFSGRLKVTGFVKIAQFTGWAYSNVLWQDADETWGNW